MTTDRDRRPGDAFLTRWNKKHRTYKPREYAVPPGGSLPPFFARRRKTDDVPDLTHIPKGQ